MALNMLRIGKPMSLNLTRCHQNKNPELTCDMLCQKCGQNQGNWCSKKIYIAQLIHLKVVKSLEPQASKRYQTFKGIIHLADWYVRMPTDPPVVDTRNKTQPKLCEETDATLEPAFPVRDSWLLH